MSNKRKIRDRPSTSLRPGLFIMEVKHDDGCPALETQRLADCTCTEVEHGPIQPFGARVNTA